MTAALASSARRRLAPAAATVIVASFATQGALMLGSVLSARLLGVEQRGSLALFAVVPVIAAHVALLGLPVGISFAVARRERDAAAVQRAVGRYLARPAIAAGAASTLALPLMDGSLASLPVLALAAVLAAGLVWQSAGLAFLEGVQAYRSLAVQRLLPAAMYSLAVVALFVAGGSAFVAFCAAYGAGQVLSATVTWRVVSQRVPPATGAGAPPVSSMVAFGARSLGLLLSPIETFRADLITVGVVLGPYALGLYFAGATFAVLPRLIGRSLATVAYPVIARARCRSEAARLVTGFSAFAAVALGAAVLLIAAGAPLLVGGLLGSDFLPAVPVVQALQVAGMFMALRSVLVAAAQGLGTPGTDGVAEIVALPVLVAGIGLGLARGEIVLVAWGVAVASAIATGVAAVLVVRALGAWGTMRPSSALDADELPEDAAADPAAIP